MLGIIGLSHLTYIVDVRDATFLCGRAGVCALGAVVAKYMGDDQLLDYFLAQFKEVNFPGRYAGFLVYYFFSN